MSQNKLHQRVAHMFRGITKLSEHFYQRLWHQSGGYHSLLLQIFQDIAEHREPRVGTIAGSSQSGSFHLHSVVKAPLRLRNAHGTVLNRLAQLILPQCC